MNVLLRYLVVECAPSPQNWTEHPLLHALKLPRDVLLLMVVFSFFAITANAKNSAASYSAVQSLLCQERSPCFIAETQDAGQATSGETLKLVYVVLGTVDSQWRDPSVFDPCTPYEVWLTRARDGRPVSWQLLAEICNDGYGASGVGMDEFRLNDGFLDYHQSGGSAWRWQRQVRFQLSPLTVRRDHHSGHWNVGPNQGEMTIEWSPLKISGNWYAPTCGSEAEGGDQAFEPGGKDINAYLAIPQVSMPKSFIESGWRSVELGDCAARVDASGQHGFIIHGHPSHETDAAFRVVAIDERTLLVEVMDDQVIHAAKTWLFEDHLEVWRGAALSYQDHCLPPSAPTEQWAVRLQDGEVIAAHGRPKQTIKAEVFHVPSGSVRVKLVFPFKLAEHGITLVYSDSDDGKKQKSLIATSQLQFGQSRTFGHIYPIDPKTALCDASRGRLHVQRVVQSLPNRPAISTE